jgi:hypothetical protein
MKNLVLMLGLISVSDNAMAQAVPATMKDAYLRCTAVTFIVYSSRKDPEAKERARVNTESFGKFAAWFYPESREELLAATGKFIQSIFADLESKTMSAEAFVELVDACEHILMDTTVKFMQCIGNDVSDARKRSCAQQAVGLNPKFQLEMTLG